MKSKEKVSVLFVCMGNICRSPTAEAVFRDQVEKAGLGESIEIDSAGTHSYHIGAPPDQRSQLAAVNRGYDMSSLRARQVVREDFARFDHIMAMDVQNLTILQQLASDGDRHKAKLFMKYSEEFSEIEVPDPYYGGAGGFERVLDMVESASRGLLKEIQAGVTA